MHYRRKYKTNDYDCDRNNELKLSAAMRYMQQTSGEQLALLGFPYEKLYAENMVFLLSKTCVKVHRNPVAGEELSIGTAATAVRGAKFAREFVIDSLEGERLVSTLTLWMLVDPSNRKILRPSSYPYQLPFTENSLIEGIIDDIRIPKPEETALRACDGISVKYSHIDCNGHVNNSIYADFICDALPYERLLSQKIDTIAISFQSEAKWGDTLSLSMSGLPEDAVYIKGHKENSACFESYIKFK